jgi:hypothetical protein
MINEGITKEDVNRVREVSGKGGVFEVEYAGDATLEALWDGYCCTMWS